MIFYFDTPYPPSGRTAWLRSHLTKKIFSFFLHNLSSLFTFLLYCIFIQRPYFVFCQDTLLLCFRPYSETLKCIFILQILNVNNV